MAEIKQKKKFIIRLIIVIVLFNVVISTQLTAAAIIEYDKKNNEEVVNNEISPIATLILISGSRIARKFVLMEYSGRLLDLEYYKACVRYKEVDNAYEFICGPN